MKIAFVLSSGGSLGAAQVGMLYALATHGIHADLVVGTSVGALNGAYYAAQPDLDGIEALHQLWLKIREHDVFPINPMQMLNALTDHLPLRPLRGVLRALGTANYLFPLNPLTLRAALMGSHNYLFDTDRFRDLLQQTMPAANLEEARIPLTVQATDVLTGESVLLSQGPTVPALLASTAIPAIYPNIEIDGRLLMDGAIAESTVLDCAVDDLGAEEVYVLPSGVSRQQSAPPSTIVAMAMHVNEMRAELRLIASIERNKDSARVHVIPPLCPDEGRPLDSAQTTELIEQAKESTTYWLEHDHQPKPGLARALGDLHASNSRDTAGPS
jgi:NTE family protein